MKARTDLQRSITKFTAWFGFRSDLIWSDVCYLFICLFSLNVKLLTVLELISTSSVNMCCAKSEEFDICLCVCVCVFIYLVDESWFLYMYSFWSSVKICGFYCWLGLWGEVENVEETSGFHPAHRDLSLFRSFQFEIEIIPFVICRASHSCKFQCLSSTFS